MKAPKQQQRWFARFDGLFIVVMLACLSIVGCGERGEREEKHTKEAKGAQEERRDHSEPRAERERQMQEVQLSPEALRNAYIEVGMARPAPIEVTADAPGEVRLNAERVLEVRPRFGGVVRELRKHIGDRVMRGEVVAVVQSNESLTDYEINSSLAGTVLSCTVVVGQTLDSQSLLYTIADLSTVWIDFTIYPQFIGLIRLGTPARVVAQNRPDLAATGTVHYVGPVLDQDTRVSIARVVLPNPKGAWQPGMFVTVRATLERMRVAVTVPEDAIVRMGERVAVFRAHGTRFELQTVLLGRSDGRTTEVTRGLAAGDSVVVKNAFILKSELGKGAVEETD